MQPTLRTAANGHLHLELNDAPDHQWQWLNTHLEAMGFQRVGEPVLTVSQSIFPDFRRGELRLLAGYDDYAGFYLLAESADGDEVLRLAFVALGATFNATPG